MSPTASSPTPARSTAGSASGSTVTVTPGVAIGAGVVLLAALVAVFWVFVQTQARYAFTQPADWGHTLFVPAISGYFIYLRRDELLAKPFRPNWALGLPLVLAGVGGYVASTFGPSWFVLHHNARGLAIGVTLFGLSTLLLGVRATRVIAFPLAYWIVFGQSVSDRLLQTVTERMQDWSAVGAWGLLAVVGLDVERSGNVITLFVNGEPRQLNVAEACSGMRMLVAFLALGVAIAYTGLPRLWQRVVLVASGVPVAIGVNVLRVFTLGILSLWSSDFAAGDFHSFIGLVWLVPALGLFLGIKWFLSNLFVEERGGGGAKAAKAAKEGASDAH